jgi:hypothetical protein
MNDLDVLDFAALVFRRPGARDEQIRLRFDCSPVRFEQRLGVLLDDPKAYAARPMLVKRLRRLRDLRREQRAS